MTTLLGDPSVYELRELRAAYDYEMSRLAGRWVEASPSWIAKDIAAAEAWRLDFEALQARYAAACVLADVAVARADAAIVSDKAVGAPLEWEAMIRALRPVTRGTRGDFRDLTTRLHEAGYTATFPNVPQPNPDGDLQLQIFKASDVILRDVETATRAGAPVLLIGALALGALLIVTRRS